MEDYVIIPTYNERKNIALMLDKVTSMYPDLKILVVDDNSPDGTADVVRSYIAKFPQIELFSRTGKLGLGSAYTQSFEKLLKRSNNIRCIITLDADFSHDPVNIKKMRELIGQYDVVIGSRYTKGGGLVNWPLRRKILSRMGNFYARNVTRTKLGDMTSGFHCFRVEILRKYDFKKITTAGFAFLMEMKIIAYRMGAKIKEIPILVPNRQEGKSKLSNRIIYEGLVMPWRWWRF